MTVRIADQRDDAVALRHVSLKSFDQRPWTLLRVFLHLNFAAADRVEIARKRLATLPELVGDTRNEDLHPGDQPLPANVLQDVLDDGLGVFGGGLSSDSRS